LWRPSKEPALLVARRIALLAAAFALAVLAVSGSMARAVSGPLVVTIEGSLGEPSVRDGVLVASATGAARFSGLLEGAAGVDGVVIAFESGDVNRPILVGSLWSSHESPPESIACVGVVCALEGPVVGFGRMELAEVEPLAGGRVSLRIVVRRAHCERCP